MNKTPNQTEGNPAVGGAYALSAFLIWGLTPVYWRALCGVGAFEIILHRMLWSFVLLMVLVLANGQLKTLARVFGSFKTASVLLVTALLVGGNWWIYVWAVNNGRVLEASLGYYINPLVNVFLGMLFLHERLRRAQAVAVLLAMTGVMILTIGYGVLPWVSLALAFSFGIYGLIRKVTDVTPLVGLTVETLLLAVPAGAWVLNLHLDGSGAFLSTGIRTDLLLVGTGVLTATPLLLFNLGAKRITLASLGFIQYTAPTCMFFLGITLFGESFTPIRAWTFGLIWTALALYSWDAVRAHGRQAVG